MKTLVTLSSPAAKKILEALLPGATTSTPEKNNVRLEPASVSFFITATNRVDTATVSRTHIDKKLVLRTIVLQHERL
jgi:hypothetical protein